MERGARSYRLGLTALAACALMVVVLLAPSAALAKSYEIADLRITASFNASGDLHVEEYRTFDFSGSYSWVEWVLEKKGSDGIEVTSLTVVDPADPTRETPLKLVMGVADSPGTYSVSDHGDSVTVHASISAADTLYQAHLTYTAAGVVKRWADCGELYWQFVGDGWGVPTRQVRVDIVPPVALSSSDVLAWAHGPLTGNVAIGAGGTVTLTVADLPSEGRARVIHLGS